MSLNKFTDIAVKKEWMDINCNELKATTFTTDTIITNSIEIVRDEATPVYITMTNEALPPNQKTYGMYSDTLTNAFYLSQFNDVPAIAKDYIKLAGSGGVEIPTEDLKISTGSVDLNNTGALLNVPSSSTAGSFYETFTSTGNTFAGAYAVPIAKEYKLTRIGNVVSMFIGTVSGAGANAGIIFITQGMPAQFRPSELLAIPIRVQDNSAFVLGVALIDNLVGGMTFSVGMASATFATTGNCGLSGVVLTWRV